MSTIGLIILTFGFLLGLIFLGHPVAFALGGVAVILQIILRGPASLVTVVSTTFGSTTNFVLLAVPLFLLMAL